MFLLQVFADLVLVVPVATLNALCWVPHGYQVLSDVCEIQIEALRAQAFLFEADALSEQVAGANQPE